MAVNEIKELHVIRELRQAPLLLNEIRSALLARLREPASATELARDLGITPQRVNNHLRELEEAGLAVRIGTRTKRNLIEGVWQAVARNYWLDPKLARTGGAPATRDEVSLHNLLAMAERLQDDAGELLGAAGSQEVPSFGLTAEVTLRGSADRDRFARELTAAIEGVVARYRADGNGEAESFTAMLVCYPSVAAKEGQDD